MLWDAVGGGVGLLGGLSCRGGLSREVAPFPAGSIQVGVGRAGCLAEFHENHTSFAEVSPHADGLGPGPGGHFAQGE